MADNLLVQFDFDIDEKSVKKSVKKLEKNYSKSARTLAKLYESETFKGVSKGFQKSKALVGKVSSVGGKVATGGAVGLSVLGAIATFLGNSEKGQAVKTDIEQKVDTVSTISTVGGISKEEALKIIQGLQKSGLSFEESATTLATFLDKRLSALRGENNEFLPLVSSKGGAKDFTNFIARVEKSTNKQLANTLGAEGLGLDAIKFNKIIKAGVGANIKETTINSSLVRDFERVEKEKIRASKESAKIDQQALLEDIKLLDTRLYNDLIKANKASVERNSNDLKGLGAQLLSENTGKQIVNEIVSLKNTVISSVDRISGVYDKIGKIKIFK